MSIHEALKGLQGQVPWLPDQPDQEQAPIEQPTAIDDARVLGLMVQRTGRIDRQSATWNRVSQWAAEELINAWHSLETARGERRDALQARCAVLRDMLAIDERVEVKPITDVGPDVP